VEYQHLSGEAKGTGIPLPTLPEAPVTPPRFKWFLTLCRCVIASQSSPPARRRKSHCDSGCRWEI